MTKETALTCSRTSARRLLCNSLLVLALVSLCSLAGCASGRTDRQVVVTREGDAWADSVVKMMIEMGYRAVCEVKTDQGHFVLDGTCEFFDTGGKKIMAIHYNNGLQVGAWTQWHPNGVIAHESHLNEKGQFTGKDVDWDETGRKTAECYWRDGKKVGIQTSWDEKGRIAARLFWANDEPAKLEQYKNGKIYRILEGSEAKAYLRARALERMRESDPGPLSE